MDMRAIINLLEAYKKGDKIGRWAFIYLEPKDKSGENHDQDRKSTRLNSSHT